MMIFKLLIRQIKTNNKKFRQQSQFNKFTQSFKATNKTIWFKNIG